MNKLALLLALSLGASLPAQESASAPEERAMVDRLVGIVNDQTLTMQEVQLEVIRFADERGMSERTPGLARVVARNLITDMLFAEGFRQAGLDDTLVGEIVNDEIQRQIRSFGSLAAYERHLSSLNRNLAVERRTIRQTIIATYFQQAELGIAPELGGRSYRSFITVSPAEIEAYFQEKNGQFSFPRMVNTRILMVRAGEDEAAARQLIEKVRTASATDPQAFAQACEQHSVFAKSRQNLTGLVDPSAAGEVAAFRDFLATAEAGAISETVERSGYLVVAQVHQVKEAKQLTVGEAHRRIESILLEEKRLVALDRALSRQIERCYVWLIPELDGLLDDVYGLRRTPEEEL